MVFEATQVSKPTRPRPRSKHVPSRRANPHARSSVQALRSQPHKLCAPLRASSSPNPMAPDVASMTSTPSTPALKPSQKPLSGPNVLEVVFGSLLIQPWYPSFYPEELVGRRVERLYVCQWCFKYSKELLGFIGHLVRFFHIPIPSCTDWGRGGTANVPSNNRKHVPSAIHPRPASTSTQKTTTRSTRLTAKSTSSTRRTSRSSPSFSSIPNPSSTMSQLFYTTSSSHITPHRRFRIPVSATMQRRVELAGKGKGRSSASSARRR